MKPDQHEFENLRRLLALKRHEAPPPGYFHFFSARVIARIEAGETGVDPSALQRMFGSSSWMQQLLGAFETRPVFSGAISLALFLLVVGGVWHSEPSAAPSIGSASPFFRTAELPADRLYHPGVMLTSFSSTNGLLPQHLKSDFLFDQAHALHLAQPVSW